MDCFKVLSTFFLLMAGSACVAGSQQINRQSVSLCFYELQMRISDEEEYEGYLKAKAQLEDIYFRGKLVVRPLANYKSVFFAHECKASLDFLQSEYLKHVRSSSIDVYQRELEREFKERSASLPD